jgi:hypothetical protein
VPPVKFIDFCFLLLETPERARARALLGIIIFHNGGSRAARVIDLFFYFWKPQRKVPAVKFIDESPGNQVLPPAPPPLLPPLGVYVYSYAYIPGEHYMYVCIYVYIYIYIYIMYTQRTSIYVYVCV